MNVRWWSKQIGNPAPRERHSDRPDIRADTRKFLEAHPPFGPHSGFKPVAPVPRPAPATRHVIVAAPAGLGQAPPPFELDRRAEGVIVAVRPPERILAPAPVAFENAGIILVWDGKLR
jgi:hypothetical protein